MLLSNLAEPFGLHQNDEDHYYGIARAMLASGDWLVPSFMGEVSFHKPPLLYWLMMASMRLLGPSVLAARLPVALCGVAVVLLTWHVASRYVPQAAGWLAGAVAATSVGFFQYGRAAMMDVPLALVVLLAATGFREAARGRVAGAYLAIACGALGTLLKGPVGAVLPLGAGIAWWGMSRRERRDAPPTPRIHWLGAAVLGLALAGAWPLALWARGLGPEWFARFIVDENFGKFQGESDSIFDMLRGFGALLMPWTLLLVAAFWQIAKERGWREPAVLLPLTFMATNVTLFSVPAVKWGQYLLPSIPMAGLLIGWAVRDGITRPVKIAGTVSAIVLMVAVPGLLMAPRLFGPRPERVLFLVVAFSLLAAAWGFFLARSLQGTALAIGCGLAAVTLLAPRLTFNRPPVNLAEMTAGQEIVAFGVPPYRYANAIGREVAGHSLPADFKRDFDRGAMIIVGDTDLANLMQAGALDQQHAHRVMCWPNWKKQLTVFAIVQALRAGNRMMTMENVCVLQKRARTMSSGD